STVFKGNSGVVSSRIGRPAPMPSSTARLAHLAAAERLLQHARQTLETAVRHQHDLIAGRALVEQRLEQLVDGERDGELRAERREGLLRTPAEILGGEHVELVRRIERFTERV